VPPLLLQNEPEGLAKLTSAWESAPIAVERPEVHYGPDRRGELCAAHPGSAGQDQGARVLEHVV
jgi:hypothetical protein